MPRVRITFLGTAGSTPTVDRNQVSVLLEYEGTGYLFDVGEGTQRQFMRYRRSMLKVKHIFISHAHGDHVFGLPGVVHTMALLGRKAPLYVWVPKGQGYRVEQLVCAIPIKLPFELLIREVAGGMFLEEEKLTVSAYPLDHTIRTLAYVWAEKPRKKADKEKLQKLGLLNNPLVRKLKEGKTVLWKGKEVRPEDIVYTVPGIKVVYAVDTRPVFHELAEGADLLIHDGTFSCEDQQLAEEKKHSTVCEAAELARQLAAKRLALIHISGRYKDVTPLVKEAQQRFGNTVIPPDGYVLEI